MNKIFYVLKGYDDKTILCKDEDIRMIKEIFQLEKGHNPCNHDFYYLYLFDDVTNICLDGFCGRYWEIHKEIEKLFINELAKEQ